MVSVCTGVFALAAAGLLDGKRATTHWRNAERLQTLYPAVAIDAGVRYIDEGSVSTSAGVAAGIDLCTWSARTMEPRRPTALRGGWGGATPGRGQVQFMERAVAAPLVLFADTCAWARQNLAEQLTVEELATHAGWSPRKAATQPGRPLPGLPGDRGARSGWWCPATRRSTIRPPRSARRCVRQASHGSSAPKQE
ncbi:DJ-1/PfpI family protein [Arthrobacter sp. UYEF21]|uniref:DJ-1/PfpI family protein n=1 Tax=Arthrobacter sp. UYEF21 TaxID=1756364 RepID=UPI0033983FE5